MCSLGALLPLVLFGKVLLVLGASQGAFVIFTKLLFPSTIWSLTFFGIGRMKQSAEHLDWSHKDKWVNAGLLRGKVQSASNQRSESSVALPY